jgi:hypothetical protein
MSTIAPSMSLPTATPYLPDNNLSAMSDRLIAGAGMHAPNPGHGVGLSAPADAHGKQSPAAVGKAFEEVFASMLVKHMRQAMGSELFGKDPGEVCGGLFDHFMSQHIAHKGSLGIGKMIEKNLEKRSTAHGHA